MEREDPPGGIFASTCFLKYINTHDNIMYGYINLVEGKSTDGDTHAEIHANNTIKITKEQLND